MSLKTKIDAEIKAAMKARDKIRLETVRSIKKLLLEREVDARAKGQTELSEDEELAVLTQLAKQRREAIAQYDTVGRTELAEQERKELAVIEEYLPQQLSVDEIRVVVREVMAQVGANSPKDMGKVMGPTMTRLKGQADGKLVQAVVKELLG